MMKPVLNFPVLAPVSAFAGVLLFLTGTAHANEQPDPLNGQKLFEASSCLNCHGSEVFTRNDRKVSDYAGLEAQVRRCDANLSTNWFDDQILDVVEYLNTNFYQFEKPDTAAAVPSSLPDTGSTVAATTTLPQQTAHKPLHE